MGRGDLLRRWEGRASEAEGEKSVTGCEGQRRTAQGLAKVPGRAVNDEPTARGRVRGDGPEPAAPQQWWWFWKAGGRRGGGLQCFFAERSASVGALVSVLRGDFLVDLFAYFIPKVANFAGAGPVRILYSAGFCMKWIFT